MSLENELMVKFGMPSKEEVSDVLLKTLFKYNGIIKEFNSNENIVKEIADEFNLSERQLTAQIEIFYKKEDRIKRSSLWNRLLYRSGSYLAKEKLVSRPIQTQKITNRKEWMLTEKGYDHVLSTLKIPLSKKDSLQVKSYEVQKEQIIISGTEIPNNYNPIDSSSKRKTVTKKSSIRKRAFRYAVIENYQKKCAICGLSLHSPDNKIWEVQASHIVPRSQNGKDDIWNGLALCHLHHWAFDVGWFTILPDYKIMISPKITSLTPDIGYMSGVSFFEQITKDNSRIILPDNPNNYPHKRAIEWHKANIFCT